MRFKTKFKVGDVCTIPIDDERCMLGQIVDGTGSRVFFFAVFDRVMSVAKVDRLIDEVLTEDVVFLAQSTDAKLYHGHWTVVANRAVRPGLPFPAFKVLSNMTLVVTDHMGSRRRPATEAEVAGLSNPTTFTPAYFDLAAKARAGLIPWEERFNKLVPHPETLESKFFPDEDSSVA